MDDADLSDIEQENFMRVIIQKIKAELNTGAYNEEDRECEDCGNLISKPRRKAMPTAIRCLVCQDNYEKRR